MRKFIYALALVAPAALAGVLVEDPWTAATPPGAAVGGAYLVIRNTGSTPERLVGADSPASDHVEMHMSMSEGNVMKMRQQKSVTIPSKGRVELKPGAGHLMFVGLKHPFKQGDTVPLILRFEHAGEIKTELRVEALGARSRSHSH
ncbi:MAG TPA: copper chaperone PCu(A)C [Burkholderiales bacterium]|nr:copper chaperone PCu(A)C [Burkholderiales bacterium]